MRVDDGGSSPLKDYSTEFMNLLEIQDISDEVRKNYEFMGAYWLPDDKELDRVPDSAFHGLFEKFTQMFNNKENADMMFGPILKCYIENVANQINRSGMVNLEKA